MKKIKRSKLYLSAETVRTLSSSSLRLAAGGTGGCVTKPQYCDTTAVPDCPTNVEGPCRTLDCTGGSGCCPNTGTCTCGTCSNQC